MSDQATHLRNLAATAKNKETMREICVGSKAKTIAITSGKGGVGKSSVALNLAIAFSQRGHRVLLLDADLNLANLDILMGLTPQFTLRDVIKGTKQLSEIIIEGPGGVELLPANSGAIDLWNLDSSMTASIFFQLAELETLYDFLIIDTAAGIAPYVMDFVVSAQEILIVTLPEPTAMMDAYAVVKLASRRKEEARIRVIINQVSKKEEARSTFEKIQKAAHHFLNASIEPAGIILADTHVVQAVKQREPFLMAYPQCPASRCITALAGRFISWEQGIYAADEGNRSFFQRLWNRRVDSTL